jgi:hypothetical protein
LLLLLLLLLLLVVVTAAVAALRTVIPPRSLSIAATAAAAVAAAPAAPAAEITEAARPAAALAVSLALTVAQTVAVAMALRVARPRGDDDLRDRRARRGRQELRVGSRQRGPPACDLSVKRSVGDEGSGRARQLAGRAGAGGSQRVCDARAAACGVAAGSRLRSRDQGLADEAHKARIHA